MVRMAWRWCDHHHTRCISRTPHGTPSKRHVPSRHPFHVKVPHNTHDAPDFLVDLGSKTNHPPFPVAQAITAYEARFYARHHRSLFFPAPPVTARTVVSASKRVISCSTPRPSWRNSTLVYLANVAHVLLSKSPSPSNPVKSVGFNFQIAQAELKTAWFLLRETSTPSEDTCDDANPGRTLEVVPVTHVVLLSSKHVPAMTPMKAILAHNTLTRTNGKPQDLMHLSRSNHEHFLLANKVAGLLQHFWSVFQQLLTSKTWKHRPTEK